MLKPNRSWNKTFRCCLRYLRPIKIPILPQTIYIFRISPCFFISSHIFQGVFTESMCWGCCECFFGESDSWYFALFPLSSAEAYLEHSRTSMMELFCKNSSLLKVVSYFCKKSSIVDVWLCSKYASKLWYLSYICQA